MNASGPILLIGKAGQVAWELHRILAPLGDLQVIGRPELDLADPDRLRQVVREAQPRIIINAAAYTAVDQAESDPDLAMRVNGVAPGILAEEAKRLNALLVHYSTDYVFDGTKSQPYLETDEPNPINVYGRSKLAGERAILAVGGAHLILRLSWVYASRGKNFLLTIMRLAAEREELRVVSDQIGSPTWSRQIAQATSQILTRLSEPAGGRDVPVGLYHLTASGLTSWHGFAQAIVTRLRPDRTKCRSVQAIATAQYPTPACRPPYSVLSCDKLAGTFGLRLPHWEASVQQVLEDLSALRVG